MTGNVITGARFFIQGIMRMTEPELRRYVAFPLLFNSCIMALSTWWVVYFLADQVPSWLVWAYWMLMPLAVIVVALTFAYFFSTVLVVISSPFNGFLSEKVERKTGIRFVPESVGVLIKRTFKRELIKLRYLIPRYLILVILTFVPVVNLFMPLVWFIFGSWIVALQYTDYSFDNHQRSFTETRDALSKKILTVLGFGAVVSCLMAVPVLNWFVMPAAVIGATMMRQQCFPLMIPTGKAI